MQAEENRISWEKLINYLKLKKSMIYPCPFCGEMPYYDSKTKNVRCMNLNCAIHSWWINIDEWNKRAE